MAVFSFAMWQPCLPFGYVIAIHRFCSNNGPLAWLLVCCCSLSQNSLLCWCFNPGSRCWQVLVKSWGIHKVLHLIILSLASLQNLCPQLRLLLYARMQAGPL